MARIVAKPASVEHVRNVLLATVEPTRNEHGCIRYDLMQNTDPTDFTFYEEWTDAAALDASAHIAAGFAQLDGQLAGPPDVRRYRFLTS